MRPGSRLAFVLGVVLSLLVGACRSEEHWRVVLHPWNIEAIGENEDARATLADGTEVVLRKASIVLNPWSSYVAGEDADERRRHVPLDDVQLLEARERAPERFSQMSDGMQLIYVVLVLFLAGWIWNGADLD